MPMCTLEALILTMSDFCQHAFTITFKCPTGQSVGSNVFAWQWFLKYPTGWSVESNVFAWHPTGSVESNEFVWHPTGLVEFNMFARRWFWSNIQLGQLIPMCSLGIQPGRLKSSQVGFQANDCYLSLQVVFERTFSSDWCENGIGVRYIRHEQHLEIVQRQPEQVW